MKLAVKKPIQRNLDPSKKWCHYCFSPQQHFEVGSVLKDVFAGRYRQIAYYEYDTVFRKFYRSLDPSKKRRYFS